MLLTDEEYMLRAQEVQKVMATLDDDPLVSGLAGLNKKIAQIQGSKDRVSALLMEAIRNRAEGQVLHDQAKGAYDRKIHELLVTDAEVQAQKTEKLRESMAHTKMAQLVFDVNHAEIELTKADAYYKILQQKYSNLESANSNLSRQISVIQLGMEIGEYDRGELGSFFQAKQMHVQRSEE